MDLIVNLVIYAAAFFFIWVGSGLIVSAAGKFSSRLKLSPFAFSFVFLGLLTSTPEFSVGLQAVAGRDPGIFVGNLLGGVIVLMLVVIPLLAIFGNGINLKNDMDKRTTIATLFVILIPAVLTLDKRVTNLEGIIMVIAYLALLFMVQKNGGIFDKDNKNLLNVKAYSYKDVLNIIVGIGIVFVSSNLIVSKTLLFAELFNISAFFISLLIIAVGTDLPELSLAIRSVISGKKDIAMGDYVGAAAASTLMFGIFTLLHNGEVLTESNFIITFVFIGISLILFYIFSSSKNFISRREGLIMFSIYIVFLVMEIVKR